MLQCTIRVFQEVHEFRVEVETIRSRKFVTDNSSYIVVQMFICMRVVCQ